MNDIYTCEKLVIEKTEANALLNKSDELIFKFWRGKRERERDRDRDRDRDSDRERQRARERQRQIQRETESKGYYLRQ